MRRSREQEQRAGSRRSRELEEGARSRDRNRDRGNTQSGIFMASLGGGNWEPQPAGRDGSWGAGGSIKANDGQPPKCCPVATMLQLSDGRHINEVICTFFYQLLSDHQHGSQAKEEEEEFPGTIPSNPKPKPLESSCRCG